MHCVEECMNLRCADQFGVRIFIRFDQSWCRVDVIEVAMRHQHVFSISRHTLFVRVWALVLELGINVDYVPSATCRDGTQSKGSMVEPLNLYHACISPLYFYLI